MLSRIMKSVIGTALVVLLVAVTACGTIQYRDIQGEFVEAVSADNAWSVSPLGASAADGLYNSILVQLTDDYIAKLDDRLKLNAWLLRAVSEWRLGELSKARVSAQNGLTNKQDNQVESRDHVMLEMLDGLIIDSDLKVKYRELIKDRPNEVITLKEYNGGSFSLDFDTALRKLNSGYGKSGPATPPEVGWFFHYHRWRIISNWLIVVTSIEPGEDRKIATTEAESKLDESFTDAMDAELNSIPQGHPLRDLISAQEAG
jgi:hypothetical protein